MSEASVVVLSRFRADLARSLARRGRKLLEAQDLEAQVQALQPLEVYFIVKELGLETGLPIVLSATHEQLQTCIDLECWNNDQPSIEDLDSWLAPFAADSAESLVKVFLSLDEELQLLYLTSSVRIWDAQEEAYPDQDEEIPRMYTMDDFFVIDHREVDWEKSHEVDPFFLITALYRHSIEEAFKLITAARWELQSQVEESALNNRENRLGDLGFCSRAEALNLFAAPRTTPVAEPPMQAIADAPTHLPALYAAPLGDDSILVRALALISDAKHLEALEQQLIYVINSAIVAYGNSPRDVAYVSEIAMRVRDTLSLGLETLLLQNTPEVMLNDADDERAAYLLRQWHLSDLFRWGHKEAMQLRQKVATLFKDPVLAHWLAQPTAEGDELGQEHLDKLFIRGVLQKAPLYDDGKRAKAFGSKHEISEADQRSQAIAERYA